MTKLDGTPHPGLQTDSSLEGIKPLMPAELQKATPEETAEQLRELGIDAEAKPKEIAVHVPKMS